MNFTTTQLRQVEPRVVLSPMASVHADVAHEKQQAAQAQAAVKQLEEQLEQLRATATQAEAAMKAAQAEAAASGERVKLQEQTGAQCTEEAMHVAAAADVQMQLQRVCIITTGPCRSTCANA